MEIADVKINVAQLERELAAHFGTILSLEPDAGIYRGEIPAGIPYGVAVSAEKQMSDNTVNFPMFEVQILGKFQTRDEAWEMLSVLEGAIPAWGVDTETFRLVSMEKRGDSVGPYTATDDGSLKYYASFNILLCLLTLDSIDR